MPETGDLRVSEAVALAHALVAHLAELEGIRILFIKGPTAVALRARPPRPSSDVDVLCEPGGMEGLGLALESCGWHRRNQKDRAQELRHAAAYLFDHSMHYIHDEWPCDIDVHYNFPGFLAPEDHVFDALWTRRATAVIASVSVPCAGLYGQAAIMALHALRDPGVARTESDLDFLSDALRQLDHKALLEFASFAAATGCSETLRPFLQRVGAPIMPDPWADPEALLRWTIRTENAGFFAAFWLIELGHREWPGRVALVWRSLWLPRDELLNQCSEGDPRPRNVAVLQARRWWRVMHSLPRAIRAARRPQRGRT